MYGVPNFGTERMWILAVPNFVTERMGILAVPYFVASMTTKARFFIDFKATNLYESCLCFFFVTMVAIPRLLTSTMLCCEQIQVLRQQSHSVFMPSATPSYQSFTAPAISTPGRSLQSGRARPSPEPLSLCTFCYILSPVVLRHQLLAAPTRKITTAR